MKLSDLSVGDKVKYGSIYGEPIVWLVADKNHTGYPSDSVTLVSERIIKIMAFDGKEPSNANSDRKSYGNNRYLWSNIRQWLNKADAAGSWYQAQHSADAPPSNANVWNNYDEYDVQAGFLNTFTADEKNAILNTTLTVAKAPIDGGGSETVTDKIFLLSTTEVGLANENGIAEGSILSLFNTSSNRIAQPTAAVVSNSEYTNSNLNTSSAWYWWLRTPYASRSRDVRNVNTGGTLYYDSAYYGYYGLRPALNLADTTTISATVGEDGCYTLVWTTPINLSVKVDGEIKQYDKGWVKVDGELREIDKIWVKVDGVLKEV